MAVIAGPALGGLSYALGPGVAYAGCGLAFLMAMAALAALGGRKPVPVHTDLPTGRIARITEGIGFIRSQPIVIGASDMVSVNIRSSLVQPATPDAMRGRVSAVNMLFIGASSELGTFESGVVASMFGTVESVVFGGIGTLFVAAIWMAAFPALRKADRVHPIKQASEACCEPVADSLI